MPKNLLLADDSKTIQQAVSMTFAREDVRVVSVDDGEAALLAARKQRPDLILADVTMPRLGGYELCQKLRADAGLKDVPVLLIGGGAPVDPSRAIAVGANGLLPKPFDSGKLIDQVNQILANPKAKPSAAPPAGATRPAGVAAPRPASPSGPPRPSAATTGAGSTMNMPRPPGLAARPASAAPPAPRAPGAGSVPPPAARPPMPGVRPPPPPAAARPAASTPPARAPGQVAQPPVARPGIPATRPPVPAAKPLTPPRPPPVEEDEEIPLDDDLAEEAPAPTPLRPVASAAASKPSLSVVPASGRAGDGGEALLREALSKASREVIEKIAWEVVPELAETIIREELERLIKERGA